MQNEIFALLRKHESLIHQIALRMKSFIYIRLYFHVEILEPIPGKEVKTPQILAHIIFNISVCVFPVSLFYACPLVLL